MSEIITGQQAEKLFKEFLYYSGKPVNEKKSFCNCGIMIDEENVFVAETEKNINGADVPTLEFFCSTQCAHEWLDIEESKDTQQAFLKASEPATELEIREKIENDYINDVA